LIHQDKVLKIDLGLGVSGLRRGEGKTPQGLSIVKQPLKFMNLEKIH